MTAAVETIDFDAIYKGITDRLKADKERRLLPAKIRVFDGDWNLRGYCKKENNASFQFIDNETGTGVLEMPIDIDGKPYYLSRWMADVHKRDTTNIHIAVDKDGARWDGRLDELLILKDEQGNRFVRAIFKHSYEELKHILAWSNPFACPPA